MTLGPAVADLKAALCTVYGRRLVDVIVYGSHARGEAHAGSDIDVIVLLDELDDVSREIGIMADAAYRVELEHGELFSLIPVSPSAFARHETPLLRNAYREGIRA